MRINNFVLTSIIIALIFIGTGCATLQTPVVEKGATAFPDINDPLVFINLRVELNLEYFMIPGKYHSYYVKSLHITNMETKKVIPFVFFHNPFIEKSFHAPLQIDKNVSNRPVVCAIPAGVYTISRMSLASNTLIPAFIYKVPDLKIIIPNQKFVLLGSLVVNVDENEGIDVGDVIQGLKFSNAKKTIFLRSLSDEEEDFATRSYPALSDFCTLKKR